MSFNKNQISNLNAKFIDNYKLTQENLCFDEIRGDLFESSGDEVSLAHCVSEDLRMGAGIAVQFKKRFNQLDKLVAQKPTIGKCVYLNDINNRRFIFYMITKEKYFHKPTYGSLKECLLNLKDLCLELNVNKLSMPRIGCGLDALNWTYVSNLIHEIFKNTPIKLNIYFI
jgi:O-acetyl-ADP-ribose deacetylase (regulator of RNase III)